MEVTFVSPEEVDRTFVSAGKQEIERLDGFIDEIIRIDWSSSGSGQLNLMSSLGCDSTRVLIRSSSHDRKGKSCTGIYVRLGLPSQSVDDLPRSASIEW